MQLVCQLNNDWAFGVQYLITWYEDDVNVSSALLLASELQMMRASMEVNATSFSSQQKVPGVYFFIT
jgi:hypothetical protein